MVLLFDPGSLEQLVDQSGAEVFLGVRDCDMARFGWMREYVVRTIHTSQCPSIGFKYAYQVPAIHVVYDTQRQ